MKKVFAMTALALFSLSCDRNEEARVTPHTHPDQQNARLKSAGMIFDLPITFGLSELAAGKPRGKSGEEHRVH